MRFIRRLLILPLLLFIVLQSSFADSINGYSDAVLLLLPRSLTYNKNDAIEMTTAKAMSASDLGSSPLTFTSRICEDNNKNLGFVRLQDTLHNMYTKILPWKGYQKSNYYNSYWGSGWERERIDTDEMFQTDNSVVLQIQTTGIFVNVDDSSAVRDFTLSCFLTEAYIEEDGSEYTALSGFPKEMELGETTTLSDTSSTTYFKSLGGCDYELYIPSTPIVSSTTDLSYYPLLMRVFDLCIVLPDTDTSLKKGYYKTEITIQSTGTYTNRTFTGTRTQESSNQYTIETSKSEVSMSETITVWGYVGSASTTDNSTFSFSVSPSTSSYSMDLGDTDTYYSVASVNFYNVTGPYTSNSEPSESTQKLKYKIYISPTNNYLTPGSYLFTKTSGTDTIPYDIYLDSSGTEFSSNCTTGIGGSGVGDGSSIPSSTYYILPNYSIAKQTMNSTMQYTETWSISSLPIYLKVDEETNPSHVTGEYKSYLYFTVVSD